MGDYTAYNSSSGGGYSGHVQLHPFSTTTAQLVVRMTEPLGMYFVLKKAGQQVNKVFNMHLSGAYHINAVNTFEEQYYIPETEKCTQELIENLQGVQNITELSRKTLIFRLMEEIYKEYSLPLSSCTLFPVLSTLIQKAYESHPSSAMKFLMDNLMEMATAIEQGEVTYRDMDDEFYEGLYPALNDAVFEIFSRSNNRG